MLSYKIKINITVCKGNVKERGIYLKGDISIRSLHKLSRSVPFG